MYAYPARFEPEGKWFNVTFPDIPEAITCGEGREQAEEYAAAVLVDVLAEYVAQRKDLPRPGKVRAGQTLVSVPLMPALKLALYEAMQKQGVRKATLAQRMGLQRSLMDRLLDLRHQSRLDLIESAFRALGKQPVLAVVERQPAATHKLAAAAV